MSLGFVAPTLAVIPTPLLNSSSSLFHSSSSFLCKTSSSCSNFSSSAHYFSNGDSYGIQSSLTNISEPPSFTTLICKATAAEYKFPDPIPEFADAETEKFKIHLLKKLPKKDIYGDSVEEIVVICTEIFNTFLHSEYGGPGTLMVEPFIDIADTLNARGLPGGPQAARTAVKWAQEHVDKDWNQWTGDDDDDDN